ncbi:Alpha/Beta hydrolase protein [Dunaliella salina]|uniref:S-formylglutathione hydrolase n=1 Tax=Dunaliella salina TaxID=3046 RepID=A0ABQ7GZX8_DUNSA|nr:Alpha/Beta hydrolase protein [Dunaliella salina]|eukprot:KAF5840157.1 Alpha/Beta hydrolase protein [Dunaliella salina]
MQLSQFGGKLLRTPSVLNKRACTPSKVTMASALQPASKNRQFGGWNMRYKVKSTSLDNTETVFTVYFPPAAEKQKVPVIYYLSGLTCTDENFIGKAGEGQWLLLGEVGVALVAPDTSPRGLNVPGESDSWDFGVGAGFYLNATEPKWKAWRMYDWVVTELPELLAAQFSDKLDLSRSSIMGHSMGGHGAMTIALKNPTKFKSVSAFSPICNPTQVPWGIKAFTGYLGDKDKEAWKQYDSTELMKGYKGPHLPLLVDQGSADSFYSGAVNQLQPAALEEACKAAGYPATIRMQDGYDHSYYFISTFVDDHLNHHAKALGLN